MGYLDEFTTACKIDDLEKKYFNLKKEHNVYCKLK